MRNILLLTSLLCFQIPLAHSTHVAAGDIRYEYVSDSVYDVYFNYYRTCSGVPFSDPSSTTRLVCLKTSKSASLKLTLNSIRDVSKICPTTSSPCYPANTYGTGEGLEQHIYSVRIDFAKAPFKALLGCGDMVLETGQCCRNGSITTGISGNFYMYLKFNIDENPKNSSPAFSSLPESYFCCHQPTRLSFKTTDVDGDSLSYELTNPSSGWNKSLTYSGSYSASNPVKTYDPTGKGTINPNSNPPQGFYLDPKSGLCVFTPTKCDDVSTMVVMVKEWRKDTSGKYQVIGTVIRDMFMVVSTCSDNNPPEIVGSLEYSVCEGDSITFVLKTIDKRKVPPPPLPAPPYDSTTIAWDSGIANATFILLNDTALNQAARFSWRPEVGQASSEPYSFTVYAEDDHCPLTARDIQNVTIRVYKAIHASSVVEKIACGVFALKMETDSGISPKMNWSVLDSNGQYVTDKDLITFSSTGTSVGNAVEDTLNIYAKGRHVIRMEARLDSCFDVAFDTIDSDRSIPVITNSDTTVCSGKSFTYKVDSAALKRLKTFEWQLGSTTSSADTFTSSITGGTHILTLKAEDDSGCVYRNFITISAKHKPDVTSFNDSSLCLPNSLVLRAVDYADSGKVQNTWLWSNGSTTDSTRILTSGTYWLNVQNSCGMDTDTFVINYDSIFQISLGVDQIICDDDSAVLGNNLPRSFDRYEWSTGEKTNEIYVKQSGEYTLTAYNSCGSKSDTINLIFSKSPVLNWPDSMLYCDVIDDVYDAENDGNTYLWHDGVTLKNHRVDQTGWYVVTVTSELCGSVSDSIYAWLLLSPTVDLGPDAILTKPFSINLNAGVQNGSYRWNTGDTGQYLQVNEYGTYWVEVSNACDTVRDSVEITGWVSIPIMDEGQLKVVPNPNSGSFVVSDPDHKIMHIEMYDELGREVLIELVDLESGFMVHIPNYTSGVFFLEVYRHNTVTRKKVLIH